LVLGITRTGEPLQQALWCEGIEATKDAIADLAKVKYEPVADAQLVCSVNMINNLASSRFKLRRLMMDLRLQQNFMVHK
jgi:hypothetical protein